MPGSLFFDAQELAIEPQISPRNWLQVVSLGLVWGCTFLMMEMALRGMSPFWLAAGRVTVAAILAGTIWVFRGRRLFTTQARNWPALIASTTLTTAVPFMLLAWGMQFVTSGFAGVTMAAVVLIVLPLAHFLVPGERMTLRRTLGFVVGFAGIVVLIGPAAFSSTGAENELLGRLACLGVATCYAISAIIVRRMPPIDPVGLTASMFLLGSLVVIPTALIVEGVPPKTDLATLFWIFLLGMFPTATANLLRIQVIRSAGPVFLGLVNYIVPVVSVLLGAIVLGEALPPTLLGAMVLILSGMGLSQYGALKRLFLRG